MRESHTRKSCDDEHGTDVEQQKDEHHKPIPPYLIMWSSKQGTALYYQESGTTDEKILANFMAWIEAERLEDEGAEPIRVVTLDATLSSGKRFPGIWIPVPEFLASPAS